MSFTAQLTGKFFLRMAGGASSLNVFRYPRSQIPASLRPERRFPRITEDRRSSPRRAATGDQHGTDPERLACLGLGGGHDRWSNCAGLVAHWICFGPWARRRPQAEPLLNSFKHSRNTSLLFLPFFALLVLLPAAIFPNASLVVQRLAGLGLILSMGWAAMRSPASRLT
jgi:hypothetical protein